MKQAFKKEESTGAVYDVQRADQYDNYKLQKRKKPLRGIHILIVGWGQGME